MNHLRPFVHAAPDLRQWEPLTRIGTAFDRIPRTVDVRRIASGRGRHNIPNVGMFLWRHRRVLADAIARGQRRRRGAIVQSAQSRPAALHAARDRRRDHAVSTPLNVPLADRPARVLRAQGRLLQRRRPSAGASACTSAPQIRCPRLPIRVDLASAICPTTAPPGRMCRRRILRDRSGARPRSPYRQGWQRMPRVEVDYHYGFSADLGGGEYERAQTFGSGGSNIAGARRSPDHPSRAQRARRQRRRRDRRQRPLRGDAQHQRGGRRAESSCAPPTAGGRPCC